MYCSISAPCGRVLLAAALVAAFTHLTHAQTGGFIAVLDDDRNNADSSKSVVYYDTDDMSSPLFAIFAGNKDVTIQTVLGQEIPDFDPRSVDSLAVNPANGDTFVIAVDRDAPAGTQELADDDDQMFGIPDNTEGDYDLLKFDFQLAYNDWVDNQGMQYVTYVNDPGQTYDDGPANLNEVTLPGVMAKVGELAKPAFNDFPPNDGHGYISTEMSFVDEDTLVLVDRPIVPVATQQNIDDATAADDAQVRALKRVSTTGGSATTFGTDEGGYNLGTTESWESSVLGQVQMDPANNGDPGSLSEIVSVAYIADEATGVNGLWIAENDQPAFTGDQVSFFEIANFDGTAGNGLKEFQVGGGTTSFVLDDNPTISTTSNDGDANDIHVNPTTGDIYIIESGFFDDPQDEPSIVIREVTSYDNGLGQIQFGAWDYVQLDLTGLPDDDTQITEGRRTAYDHVNNVMYFYDFDNVGEGGGGSFVFDWYAIDLDTGQVIVSEIDSDESTRGFGFEDRYEFFFLQALLLGDANKDGLVTGADLISVQQNFGKIGATPLQGDANNDGQVTGGDLISVQQNFGKTAGPAAVPEPGSLVLLGLGGLALRRRRPSL